MRVTKRVVQLESQLQRHKRLLAILLVIILVTTGTLYYVSRQPRVEIISGRLSVSTAQFDIEPAKVRISLPEGSKAQFPLTVYNTGDTEISCVISARSPDYTTEGHSVGNTAWIFPSEITGMIPPQSHVTVPIQVSPNFYNGVDKAEVWISVTNAQEKHQVKTELCSRILLAMK